MKNSKAIGLFFLGLSIVLIPATALCAIPDGCLSSEEETLVELINSYRNNNGLSRVPVSYSLSFVAQWHVIDLHENEPDTGSDHGYLCNMHSWSDAYPNLWGAVCYTSDHAYAEAMWDKPREITDGVYWGNGFENAYGSSEQTSASGAFNGWINSPPHNDVILEQGIWAGQDWPAMGVAIYEHHAVLWFGDQIDPAGTASGCEDPTYPDLIVQSPSVTDTSLTPGQSFTVNATVRNQGDATSNTSTLRYYRSTDSTITTGDTQLTTDYVASLTPNGTSGESATVAAPATTGTYWIGACVDSVSGESNIGNNCSTGVQVVVETEASEKVNIVPILQLLLLRQKTTEFNGLEWQYIYSSQVLELSWAESLAYCSKLQLNGKNDWRLPNIDELKKAYQISVPSLATLPPPSATTADKYIWSSSEVLGNPLNAYYIYGNDPSYWANTSKESIKKAHCVRDLNQ